MFTVKGLSFILSNEIFQLFLVHPPDYYIDEPPVDIDAYLSKYCLPEEGAEGGSGYEGQNA